MIKAFMGISFMFFSLCTGQSGAEMRFLDPETLALASAPDFQKANDAQIGATLNGMGYVYFVNTPVTQHFINTEARPGRTILEIGCGFSNTALQALKKDVGSYTANDLSHAHLTLLVQRIRHAFGDKAAEKLTHLKLLEGKAPEELPDTPQEYDAILAEKVIHFMRPPEIKQFMAWAKKALKPNGRLYITASSPYASVYKSFFPEYLEKRAKGLPFPGYFMNVMQRLDPSTFVKHPDYKVPDQIVVFSREDLADLFEKEGWTILESYALKIPKGDETTWQSVSNEESHLVGIIAMKSKRFKKDR